MILCKRQIFELFVLDSIFVVEIKNIFFITDLMSFLKFDTSCIKFYSTYFKLLYFKKLWNLPLNFDKQTLIKFLL